ncbi:glycoprotein H [Harp seal herpesvirus]|uniref:Glycoprotein H n=1 Tax=phocid gammaherpesvirus 3 TaxID=2560643 RepID=A0A0R5ZAK0_9GAMA|nr:glycoprotein H [Harp seal herpesvirus]AJG42948.1 glycoprotein H [Harp seal herpesvirus]
MTKMTQTVYFLKELLLLVFVTCAIHINAVNTTTMLTNKFLGLSRKNLTQEEKLALLKQNYNFTHLLSTKQKINIQFDTQKSYTLTWKFIMNPLTPESIQLMWDESNLTENLMTTLTKYQDLWKLNKSTIVVSQTITPQNHCPVPEKQKTYNLNNTLIELKGAGYLGNFGIPSMRIVNDLFYFSSDLFRPRLITHDIFYNTKENSAYFSFLFNKEGYELFGFITKTFSYVTLVKHNTKSSAYLSANTSSSCANYTAKFATWLFGNNRHLPVLKGNLMYDDNFILVKNNNYSLALLTSFQDAMELQWLGVLNYTDIFLKLTKTSPIMLIKEMQDIIVKLEAQHHCFSFDLTPDLIEFTLKFAFTHFMISAGLLDVQPYVQMQCIATFMHEMMLLRDMAKKCFPSFYFKGFSSTTLKQVAGYMVANTPVRNIYFLPQKTHRIILTMLSLADEIMPLNEKILWGLAEIVSHLYTKYTNSFYLTNDDRRVLLDVYELLNDELKYYHVSNNTNLLFVYLLSSSMCNSLEIATLISRLSRNDFDIFETFSPCYMSLRYDFSLDKLLTESKQVNEITYRDGKRGATGLLQLIKDRHFSYLKSMPISTCFKLQLHDVLMIIPMKNITYVVSKDIISNAINYEVSETFIKSKLIVSALHSNCSTWLTHPKHKLQIPIVYNLTRADRGCPLCEAAFISYDEKDGLESMMYVPNSKVQENLFLDTSPFFDTHNLHTHYLMLFNNGTVIEIRGKYRKRATNVIILSLFLLSLGFGSFFMFKIVTHCL